MSEHHRPADAPVKRRPGRPRKTPAAAPESVAAPPPVDDVVPVPDEQTDNGEIHLERLPPDKLLRIEQVLSLIPLGKSAWLKGVRAGRFPKAVKISSRVLFWRAGDIRVFIQKMKGDE